MILALAWPSASLAYLGLCCAHCGGNMPLNVPGGGIPETHEWRFKVSQMFMQMGSLRDGTNDIPDGALVGAPPGAFPAVPTSMQMHMTMFSTAYSFTDNFALMGMTSFKFNQMDMAFNAALQAVTGQPGFTMESKGLGDIKLVGKYRLLMDDHLAPTRQLSALFGVSIPTGSINKKFTRNPAPGVNGTLLPFKMQLGSGTLDPIVGLTFQGSHDPFWYGANAIYTARVYDNDQGYQQGDEVRVDLYGMYQVHKSIVTHFQLNGSWEDRYSNEPDSGKLLGHGHIGNNPANPLTSPLFDPGNYGGTKLNITAGLQWQPFPLNIVELNASVPIYQDLNGPQMAEDYRIMLPWYIELPTARSRRYTGTEPPKELGF